MMADSSLTDVLRSAQQANEAAQRSYVIGSSDLKEGGFVGRTLFTVGKVPFMVMNRLFRLPGSRSCHLSDTQCFWIFFVGTILAVYGLWTHAEHVRSIRQLPQVMEHHVDYARHVIKVPGESLREPVFPFTFTMQDGQEEWLPTIREQFAQYHQSVMREVTPLSAQTLDEFARYIPKPYCRK